MDSKMVSDSSFRLDAGKPGAFDNSLDEVLLDQDGSPLLVPKQTVVLAGNDGRPQVEW